MVKTLHRKHWYDGWIYSTFIDRDHIAFREKLLSLMPDGKNVIDVGCGSGGFTLQLARKSRYALGVDISAKMIRAANERKQKAGIDHLEFEHVNAAGIREIVNRTFDYATFSFMIHEIPAPERSAVLNELRQVARVLVILDYNTPLPLNGAGIMVRTIEFFAGREHFRNFKDFVRRGGLPPLLKQTHLPIQKEKVNRQRIFRVVAAGTENTD